MKQFQKLTWVLIFTLSTPFAVQAEDFDYSQAINLAGKQRMLTQKMSKEALLISLGVDKAANAANLKTSHDLFDKTLKGLKNGDDSLGLQATDNAVIKKSLDEVSYLWKKFGKAANDIAASASTSDEQLNVIATYNLNLLKFSNKAVKLFEASSATGDLSPEIATAVNLAGRQRMLTQKMSKEFLMIAKDIDAEDNRKNLIETMETFDTTLSGLINGSDELGLSPAPTKEIKTQLEKVRSMWIIFKLKLQAPPNDSSIAQVSKTNLPLLKEMNEAVVMYTALGQ